MLAPVKPRLIRAPRGTTLNARSWLTEAPLRMLMNNLDPDVAENPAELVVYGGIGRAARDWNCYDRIVRDARAPERGRNLAGAIGQAGRCVPDACGRAARAHRQFEPGAALGRPGSTFTSWTGAGLAMYGQMTAGSWIYIGSQGIVQGTYETFAEMARRDFGGRAAGKWILTAGLGGMGGAQPLASTMAGFNMLAVECRESRIAMRLKTGYLDAQAGNPR